MLKILIKKHTIINFFFHCPPPSSDISPLIRKCIYTQFFNYFLCYSNFFKSVRVHQYFEIFLFFSYLSNYVLKSKFKIKLKLNFKRKNIEIFKIFSIHTSSFSQPLYICVCTVANLYVGRVCHRYQCIRTRHRFEIHRRYFFVDHLVLYGYI